MADHQKFFTNRTGRYKLSPGFLLFFYPYTKLCLFKTGGPRFMNKSPGIIIIRGLHLYTNKQISHLPFKKFDRRIPLYPSRQQVIEYLAAYQAQFCIAPLFNTRAFSIAKVGERWIIHTNNNTFRSRYLVMATGPFCRPRQVSFLEWRHFPEGSSIARIIRTGEILPVSRSWSSASETRGAEIAIDLREQGAIPTMSVHSPVNVGPRDIFGIPIGELSLLLSRLPPRLADRIATRPIFHRRYNQTRSEKKTIRTFPGDP
jgi:hypothetical protein